MRRYSLLALLFLLPFAGFSQDERNRIITDTTIHEEILYGYCDLEGLKQFHLFEPYFQEAYTNYKPNAELLAQIGPALLSADITIVLGTWCSDSQEQVPAFIRILDAAAYDYERLTIIATDRQKQAEGTNLAELVIELVPTFLFYIDGEEKGRIVETPMATLEEDIHLILSADKE